MTKAQQNKINMIRKQAEKLHGSDKDFEIKRFDVSPIRLSDLLNLYIIKVKDTIK